MMNESNTASGHWLEQFVVFKLVSKVVFWMAHSERLNQYQGVNVP